MIYNDKCLAVGISYPAANDRISSGHWVDCLPVLRFVPADHESPRLSVDFSAQVHLTRPTGPPPLNAQTLRQRLPRQGPPNYTDGDPKPLCLRRYVHTECSTKLTGGTVTAISAMPTG